MKRQFWGREFMSSSQKYEERAWKFSFLARHHFKAELYRFIYIAVFGKHLSELYWIVLTFLDPQCIVSLEDFQNRILNLSTLLLQLWSLNISRVGKRGQEL